MPILRPQADIHPSDLLDRPEVGSPNDPGRWYAINTKSRQEKKLMDALRKSAIEFYGVMHMKNGTTPGGRSRQSQVPLFPGYLFLHGDNEAKHKAMCTGHAALSIEVPSGEQAQLTKELRILHMLLGVGNPVSSEAKQLIGDRVRITQGPLKGIEGRCIQTQEETRFYIGLSFLRQMISMPVERNYLESST